MKKYQMPNVKEVKLESSLFIMQDASPTQIQGGPSHFAPKVQHGV